MNFQNGSKSNVFKYKRSFKTVNKNCKCLEKSEDSSNCDDEVIKEMKLF